MLQKLTKVQFQKHYQYQSTPSLSPSPHTNKSLQPLKITQALIEYEQAHLTTKTNIPQLGMPASSPGASSSGLPLPPGRSHARQYYKGVAPCSLSRLTSNTDVRTVWYKGANSRRHTPRVQTTRSRTGPTETSRLWTIVGLTLFFL